ncbi:MAG TPA: anti-sigma factor [Rhizobium sp.]
MSLDDETILLITAYQDGELSPSETLLMERRIASEPEVRALAEQLQKLSFQLRGALAGDPVPEALRGNVIGEIGFSDDVASRRSPPQWLPIAASLLIGTFVGGGVVAGLNFGNGSVDRSISDTVFEAHLRSLAAPQPFDIASSDRHVVKPWFNGKVGVAPSAPDLSSAGFPLIGGRVDIVSGASVPVLVYRHDRHIISVTVLPRKPGASQEEETRDGSNIERWTIGDLSYWAVSDLNRADLSQFIRAFKAAP